MRVAACTAHSALKTCAPLLSTLTGLRNRRQRKLGPRGRRILDRPGLLRGLHAAPEARPRGRLRGLQPPPARGRCLRGVPREAQPGRRAQARRKTRSHERSLPNGTGLASPMHPYAFLQSFSTQSSLSSTDSSYHAHRVHGVPRFLRRPERFTARSA